MKSIIWGLLDCNVFKHLVWYFDVWCEREKFKSIENENFGWFLHCFTSKFFFFLPIIIIVNDPQKQPQLSICAIYYPEHFINSNFTRSQNISIIFLKNFAKVKIHEKGKKSHVRTRRLHEWFMLIFRGDL